MKKILCLLFLSINLWASGGDTLNWSTPVKTLVDNDTFFADKHWGSMRDTIAKVVNGRLGNVNISATANIKVTKLDTLGFLKIDSIKGNHFIGSISFDTLTKVKKIGGKPAIDTAIIDSATIRAIGGTVRLDSVRIAGGIGGTVRLDSVRIAGGIGGTVRLDSVRIARGIGGTLKVDSINSIRNIKANGFNGPLIGNVTGDVTGNTSGSSGSCTGNAATATIADSSKGTHHLSGGNVLGDSLNIHGTVIEKNGNVGIGTTNPDYTLQIRRPTAGNSLGIALDNVVDNVDVLYYSVGDATNITTGHVFYTRNASATDVARMAIIANGNVGIGNAAPTEKLTVKGNISDTGNGLFTGTVTATGGFVGNVTGNTSGSSGSCTGNAATSSSCTGNAATSSSCTGNAATATTATNQSGGTVSATTINASSLTTLDSLRTGKGIYTPSISGPFGSVRINGTSSTSTLQLDGMGNGYQFQILNSYTPLTSGESGAPGNFAWDANYIYVYTGSVWKRVALASF